MQVTIDGVPFVPACASASRIGIAITTHNRSDVLNRAIEQHNKHLPAGALVVVIDDGSKPVAVVPDCVQLLRHETSLGIVASKKWACMPAMLGLITGVVSAGGQPQPYSAIYKSLAKLEGSNTRIFARPQTTPGGNLQNVTYSNLRNVIMAINCANYD